MSAGGGARGLLDPAVAERVLARALANGGHFAEVFAERRRGASMAIDESRIESVQSGAEEGAGVRVVDGNTTYFAHVDGLDPADLERAADEAAAALRGERREPRALKALETEPLPIATRPEDVPAPRKADLLRELDERGRGRGAEVAQFTASYAEARREVTVANSDGLLASDDRTRTRIGAQAVARRDGSVETGAETLGAHRGFELLVDDPARIAEQAADKALTLLEAGPAPSGSMPVVVGGGFGGVLFHEMTGHGLEADHVQKGASVYAGKLGEQVAQPLLNAFDDGRLPNEWGSDAIDDEGVPTQKTQVIEDGRLVAYLYDHLTAERDGVASTGNGRRESFRHLPIPRMTNTYIAPGSDLTPEQMIADVRRGFYAVSFGGGQVDPATGDFVFGVSEGYLIEDGEVTRPCRGATLIGNCLEALRAIDAVGADFFMKTGICGKGGQRVPVGTGQGHVRVEKMTVGGTEL
ncbi:MAG: TldD/PmbA family protein [Syntrophothermus sp.]